MSDTRRPAANAHSLPGFATALFRAQDDDRPEAAQELFTPDATVTDVDETFVGVDEIRGWLSRTNTAFRYTREVTSVTRTGADEWRLLVHLEGDFPGGVVDLVFDTKAVDDRIRNLEIRPVTSP